MRGGLLFFILMPDDISGMASIDELELRVEIHGMAVFLIDVKQIVWVIFFYSVYLIVCEVSVEDDELVAIEPDCEDWLGAVKFG